MFRNFLIFQKVQPKIYMLYKLPLLYLQRKVKSFFRKPFMQRLRRNAPWLFSFMRERFKPNIFFGLPFTILLVLTSINLAMLSELAEHVVNSTEMKSMDMQVSGWFYNFRTPVLSLVLYYFTQLGSVYGVTAITLLISIILLWKRMIYQVFALLISLLGSSISMYFTKLHFHRERPLNIAYYTSETSFSFPSGHATGVMALVGLLCYFALGEIKGKRTSITLLLLGIGYISLMGISRIYLGVHFLTDVAAGYLLGFLWVLLAIGLMEYVALKKLKPKRKQ